MRNIKISYTKNLCQEHTNEFNDFVGTFVNTFVDMTSWLDYDETQPNCNFIEIA